ncbi:MAG: two-component sensor histidine kinase [Gammaproteobacteria bacterium]|nr:MAG: two-component sensor histidine kinase [Gammaproteobacteria bacterium]
MDIRYVLAENIVLETILPILLMLPLMGILIWTIISYGLSPLRVLAKELGNKRADDLTPLAIDKQPVELIQVVNSTNDLFNRLKAAFLREKRFASDAAHELRTPISAIKIHLHNLSHLIPEDESSFKQLKLSVDRMGHLVEQILNLNRTSTEQYSARFNSFDLYDLVQEIIINEYEHFAEKNLKIALEGEHCQLEGDKFSLEILVQNLLSNAYKYTPEGGSVLLNVGLDKTADTSNIILQVEDSGPGVPEDQYERLFDRFYRLDGDCHASGTIGCGLGLAIVQQIVELHHAKIILGKSGFPSGLLVQIVFSKKDPQ